jgi:hypothetical protein
MLLTSPLISNYTNLFRTIKKREVTITSKEGVLNDKKRRKGKQISFQH